MIDPGTNLRKAVFLDRDGTLMHDVGYCVDPTQVQLLEGVIELLPKLKETGFILVVITNQSGIGRKYFRESDFWKVQEELDRKVGADVINATYVCPDPPDAVSERRKPRPGMLLEAANDLGIDLKQSYMVGDKISDVEAGIHAGVKGTILLEPAPSSGALSSGASLIAKNFREAVEFILSK